MTRDELVGIARRRAATYWLLSRLVLEPPTRALLDELRATLSSSALDAGEPLATEVQALVREIDAVSGAPAELALRVEHARLWGGLSQGYGPPPPFESVIREQRLPGDASTTVAALYEATGIAAEIEDAGPADYLASELRFIALCAMREAESWMGARDAEALEWQDRQREFLDEHLLAWAPVHCSSVADMARTEYHRSVANLVAGACRLDAEACRDAIAA